MSSKPFKIAFIGAGFMTGEHMKAFSDIKDFELAGLTSRTRPKAEALAKQFGVPHVTDTVAELYEATQADLVVISVPELATRQVCEQAFRFPWKCLIEKPAGYDHSDAKRILDVAQAHKIEAFVALNRRHYSSTRKVLSDLIEVNDQRFISIWDQQDATAARNAGQPELVVQNWMYANAIHTIDYLCSLSRGEVQSVEVPIPWDPAKPGTVVAIVTFTSGDIGVYQAVWSQPGPWSVVVNTPGKRWEMRPLEQLAEQVYGSRKLEPIALSGWDQTFKAGLRQQAEECLNLLRGQSHHLPTLAEGMKTMHLVEAIYGKGYRA